MSILSYGALCALMIICAYGFAPKDRFAAHVASFTLCADWILFRSAFWGVGPAHWAKLIGIPATHADAWMLTDALAGAVIIVIGLGSWWSLTLWGLLSAQVLVVGIYSLGGFEYSDYYQQLDALFYAQIAVFVFGGGRGIVDSLSLDSWLFGLRDVRDRRRPGA